MTKKEFAKLLNISTRTLSRMIKKNEIEIDIVNFVSKNNISYSDFLNGYFYTREAIKKESGLDQYEFNRYWLMQGNKECFKIGKRKFYKFKE